MRRREFITLLGGAAAFALRPPNASAQAGRVARIGYLSFLSATQNRRGTEAFRAGLRDLGYVEGGNIQIEFRFADNDKDLEASLAAELVRLNVDVIVTATGVPAAQRATRTIPIVMATYSDAAAVGIASIANPGGNVTGSTFFYPELMAKRLELLKEAAPSVARAGVFTFRGSESNDSMLKAIDSAAKVLGMELQPFEIGRPAEFEGAFSALASLQAGALLVGDHAFFLVHADTITALAAERGLPSIGPLELSGGLMSYGVSFPEQFRRAAVFVDKILKGSKPGDIPIEQATKFKTIVNLKTAKALGVTLPTSILLRADEVIE